MEKIRKLMKYETAGDPITGLKWTRRTTENISNELATIGIKVSKNTVGKLLKNMGYSLKVNQKKIAAGGKKMTVEAQENRDKQFKYIGKIRTVYANKGFPIISVDTKKKEKIGNFKNPGTTWCIEGEDVYDHDFLQYAVGKFIPFSIYDTIANIGSVFVGITHDTPSFAVDSIVKWWSLEGRNRYSDSKYLLILADSGGSNSYRSRVWKNELQEKLCDHYGLTVSITHFPPGCSKWNPADHRLHSEISKNWAGKPLKTYETALKLIRTTTTKTGLKVNAYFNRKQYDLGKKVSDEKMRCLPIRTHNNFPSWNYTLYPKLGHSIGISKESIIRPQISSESVVTSVVRTANRLLKRATTTIFLNFG